MIMNNTIKNICNPKVVCLASVDSPSNSVYSYAKKQNLTIYTWPQLPAASTFDVGVVASFGKLIPSRVIKGFPYGIINVHPSLIPKLRGAAPIARAIEAGLKSTGVSVLKISPKKFDRGLILGKSEEFPIGEHFYAYDLSDKLAEIGGEMLVDTLRDLPLMLQNAVIQNESDATYAPKIKIEDTYIDWKSLTAQDVWNKYRAYGFNKSFCLRCFYNGKLVNGNLIKLSTIEPVGLSDLPKELLPGEVVFDKNSRKLLIGCKSGCIACSKLIITDRKPQTAVDFYNGFMQTRIKRGEVILFHDI